jgi:hypothetical protein
MPCAATITFQGSPHEVNDTVTTAKNGDALVGPSGSVDIGTSEYTT